MKILIDARMAYPATHGIARYTLNLVRGLRGHADIHLLVASPEAKLFFQREVPWVSGYIRARVPFSNPLDAVELSLIIPKVYDRVHFTSFSVPLHLPKHSVITIHDLIHLKEGASLLHKIYYSTVVKRALKNCEKIISVSEWTKKDLVREFELPESKITVIPNGLESQWFADTPAIPKESKFKEARGLRTNYICCVANTKAHKNLQTLLSACEVLWNQGRNFELALAAGTDKLPENFKLNPLYLPRVRLLTKLSEQELMALYKYARVTVCPSRYEGYGFPVAESLAMHTPVVLSSASAHNEFSGEGLHFYSPYDSVAALAKALGPLIETKRSVQSLPTNVISQNELALKTLAVYR